MKVAEVREELKKYDQETMIELFVSVYKGIPKSKRESDIDPLIKDYQKVISKRKNKEVVKLDAKEFDLLAQKIEFFIENAYASNYFAPNRIIPKSQRSRWRFMVKDYIKQLDTVEPSDSFYEEAVGLLQNIYKVLSYACGTYLFSTDNPFRSVGISQVDLYHGIVRKTFATGFTRDKVNEMILLIVTQVCSSETIPSFLFMILVSFLKTKDERLVALLEAKHLVEKEEQEYQRIKKDRKLSKSSYMAFRQTERIENLVELVMYIYTDLSEVVEGMQYYFKHSITHGKEEIFDRAMDIITYQEDEELWCQGYEYGVRKRKIKPENKMLEKYQRIMKNNT